MDDSQPPLNSNQDQSPEVVAHYEERMADESVVEIEAARQTPRSRRRLQLNAQGQLILPTEAEHAAITEGIKKMIERIREIPNAPGEDDRDFFRAMDSLRPDRPLFKGLDSIAPDHLARLGSDWPLLLISGTVHCIDMSRLGREDASGRSVGRHPRSHLF